MLLGVFLYGKDFPSTDEMVVTGPGERGGEAIAQKVMGRQTTSCRARMCRNRGEGPPRRRRSGRTAVTICCFIADRRPTASRGGVPWVKGDRDPGYGSTSKNDLGYAAICLLRVCAGRWRRVLDPGGCGWGPQADSRRPGKRTPGIKFTVGEVSLLPRPRLRGERVGFAS